MTYQLTILGCGSSGGVPRIGGIWGACDPSEPKNQRRRCSVLIEKKTQDAATRVLVDTSPDMREQLLDVNINSVDGVLYTHDHADHVHGIDDLRVIALHNRKRVPVYFDERTGHALRKRFKYCFEAPKGSPYPPILDATTLQDMHAFHIEGEGGEIEIMPFAQHHGDILSYGFRFGNVAYSSDVSDLPESSLPALENLDMWIVDALRYSYHPSHFSVEQALEWIERLKPKKAILTHMHVDLDYQQLKEQLPDHIVPAYDGMVIDIT